MSEHLDDMGEYLDGEGRPAAAADGASGCERTAHGGANVPEHDGFLRVAAATPAVRVGDVVGNAAAIRGAVRAAHEARASVLILPELCLCGYTCGDLFHDAALLRACDGALAELLRQTAALPVLFGVGLPVAHRGAVYNAVAVCCAGRLLGLSAKVHLPTYREFYEARWFTPAPARPVQVLCAGQLAPLAAGLVYRCADAGCADVAVGVEVCEDLWVAAPPSIEMAQRGATVILNASASDEVIGKAAYRRNLVSGQSARLFCAYAYADAGEGESTTDVVFAGENLIAEDGALLASTPLFSRAMAVADIDLARLVAERRRTTTWVDAACNAESGLEVPFSFAAAGAAGWTTAAGSAANTVGWTAGAAGSASASAACRARAAGPATAQQGPAASTAEAPAGASVPSAPAAFAAAEGADSSQKPLDPTASAASPVFPLRSAAAIDRVYPRLPFVPADAHDLAERCETILNLQAAGLATRLAHTGTRSVTIGLSGGLDSTLALLVCVRAFDRLGLARTGIHAVSMPGFGTTKRTKSNAERLAGHLGVDFRTISIAAAVERHFTDIGHDPAVTDVTYENAQARERTQILMDLAGELGGFVVGTGDLSELALGWATYNADHMSMYGVNASVPKTLVRHLVRYAADALGGEVAATLLDILDTPVSPELLPPTGDGEIAQRTEDLVGPYELHDYFLYYLLRFGFTPGRIYRMACRSFAGAYEPAQILFWLRTFYRRFFSQQFKRSCLPDGPKVGSVTLSPRGDWRMPSDASAALWLAELDRLEA